MQQAVSNIRTLSGINVVVAIWLIIAPFVLAYGGNAALTWNEVVFGIILGILSLVAAAMPRVSWPSWVNMVVGIWLIVSPFALAGTAAAYWNLIISGLVAAILAYSAGTIANQTHARTEAR